MATGKCEHGEFDLDKGCPQCIAKFREARLEPQKPPIMECEGLAEELEEMVGVPNRSVPNETEAVIRVDSGTCLALTPLVTVNPELDPQVVAFYNEAVLLQKYAEERVIKTLEDMKPANDDLNVIRKLKKAMEARRKEYLAPFHDHVKEVNDAYKKLMAPVDIADKVTTDKMLAFNRELERIRQEQERINRQRQEAAEAEMRLKGEISEPVNLVEVIAEAPKRTATDFGSSGMRDNWQWEVTDINLVPREYLMINAGMLTPVVKASKGKLTIPGLRIYNNPILATGR